MAPVHFYYPPGLKEEVAPESIGVFSRNRPGNYIWTVKTQGQLAIRGFDCFLTDRLPDSGIIVTHRQFLPNTLIPRRDQLFVCVVADFRRHPFAQLHIVQNPTDPMLIRSSPAWDAHFMPHWPETGLIRRDPERGDTFINVSYFGLPERLAPQLRSERFAARLREEGFNFRVVPRDQWNDYSNTDAVLAVRSFAPVSFHKFPPTKLYNSWIAGVPALLGRESAYQAERRGEYDYFEVKDADDVLRTLIRLRKDPDLRAAVVQNAAARAVEVEPARIAAAWATFFTTVAIPAHERWSTQTPSQRNSFVAARRLRYAGFVVTDFMARGLRLVGRKLGGMGA